MLKPGRSLELIETGVYIHKSDFVRDVIRHRLSEIKVIECKDVDYDIAKEEILGDNKNQGEAYPEEPASDLALDFYLAMKATQELRKASLWKHSGMLLEG